MMQTIVGTDITRAAALLREDELVAIPTETVYGLAGNALHEAAVIKIYEAKNRPRFNPLILHLADIWQIEKYALLDAMSSKLANAFMPGPFTLLLPKKNNVPDLVTAGSDKVAIRVPDHALTRSLLALVDFPLAAPSANLFGYVSPTTAEHVLHGLGGKISYILDGGPSQVGVESSIAEVQENSIVLHRSGGVGAELLTAVTGLPVISNHSSHAAPSAPGQLKSHYATGIPLYKGNLTELVEKFAGKKIAIISFKDAYTVPGAWVFTLSPSGNLGEAAQKLFATMRTIDQMDVELILAEDFPDTGIGRAINDRLNRAQAIFK